MGGRNATIVFSKSNILNQHVTAMQAENNRKDEIPSHFGSDELATKLYETLKRLASREIAMRSREYHYKLQI